MSEDDPEYNVPMGSTTDISVLKSKDWFDWKDENVKLTPNQALTFQTSSSYRYKEKGVFASVNIEGLAFLTGIGSAPNALVQVAIVSYTSATPSKGNPVLEYLKRSGKPPYSQASADWNPIHCNPYFANLASLPGTITHGMWSSAATRSVVERIAAEGHGSRVKSYNVAFTGMLLPNTTLKIELKQISQTLKGLKLISVTTYALPDKSSSSAEGTKVLDHQELKN
ncbi:hypothetical protein PSTG_12721 [Puccinia striiformis f. sp. tritici PST-78]|uniref:MaoC-like domain-containing protein n=1 Tax=Puccinia striiformis f. sp. tritici PST-78 TaxID=1165861 RepID=A0A0L0V3P9_9BASI|nr:hypothetical protein PSTG_12721 [Puccinia striiformis f. sp. tritici PST-78]